MLNRCFKCLNSIVKCLGRQIVDLAAFHSAENHTITDMHFLGRRDETGMEHWPSLCKSQRE